MRRYETFYGFVEHEFLVVGSIGKRRHAGQHAGFS